MREKMNKEQLNKTLITIPDSHIRQLIFGESDIRSEDLENYISNMNNLILFSFFVYYKVWQDQKIDNPILDELFRSVYTKRSLTLELVSYILGEIQIDVSKNETSIFKDLIHGKIEDSQIPVICELIMQWKKSYNEQMMNISKLREYYNSLLNNFVYLKKVTLDDNFILTLENHQYDLSLLIKITDDDDYYLSQIEDGEIDVILIYASLARNKYLRTYLPKKDLDKRYINEVN
jgi:hypothetical protein